MLPLQNMSTASSSTEQETGLLPGQLQLIDPKTLYATKVNRLSAVRSNQTAVSSGSPSASVSQREGRAMVQHRRSSSASACQREDRATMQRRGDGSRTPPRDERRVVMSPGTDALNRIIEEQRLEVQQLREMMRNQLPQQQAVAREQFELQMKEDVLRTAAVNIIEQGQTVAQATVDVQQREAELRAEEQRAQAEIHRAEVEAQENIAKEERAAQESLQRQRVMAEAHVLQQQRAAEEQVQRQQAELQNKSQRQQQMLQDLEAGRVQLLQNAESECERIRQAAAEELRIARQQIAEAQATAKQLADQVNEEQRLRRQAENDHQIAMRLAEQEQAAEQLAQQAREKAVQSSSSERTAKSSPLEYSIFSPRSSVQPPVSAAAAEDPEKSEMRQMLKLLREEVKLIRDMKEQVSPSKSVQEDAVASPVVAGADLPLRVASVEETFQLDSSDEDDMDSQRLGSSHASETSSIRKQRLQFSMTGSPPGKSPPDPAMATIVQPRVGPDKKKELDEVKGIGPSPTVAGWNSWRRSARYAIAGASATPNAALSWLLIAENWSGDRKSTR